MVETEKLSEAVRLFWGKAGDLSFGSLPLWRHLADCADVAALLWDLWLSDAVKRRISREFPDGDAGGRSAVRWLAGVHDVGKATPAFASKVDVLARRMRDFGFTFDKRVKADQNRAPHSMTGHVLLLDWLERRHNWARWQAEPFAVVVGGHHGVPPTDLDLQFINDHPYLVGVDGLWPAGRDELLDWMADRVDVTARLPVWREVELSQPAQVLLTAIIIVADWIASNEELFPYAADQWTARNRVELAWQQLDLPAPWRAVDVTKDNTALFRSRFSLPEGARPFPVQEAVANVARTMPVPGLLIVEAPMGEGKTEAALAAVEILCSRTGASGCFVALPTRATSDAMFGRVLPWLAQQQDKDVGRGAHDVVLAHGKAAVNIDFVDLYRRALPTAIGVDEGGADIAVHRWLAGRKRKLLSNFAIGTIDQLLFAALRARHVVLRHLGLAGKVVVIDEAHAYDVYMRQFLDRALLWLGAHQVPVVVLSATLPPNRRAEMMAAYDEGRLGRTPPPPRQRHPVDDNDPYQTLRDERRYPLLTVSGTGRDPVTIPSRSAGRDLHVQLERHDDDPSTLVQTLQDALALGGCALVVRNTVARVQHTALVLRELLGPSFDVSVAHSRFMAPDRAAKDTWLRDTFGPSTRLTKLGRTRPERHIVVASQVAEQSLDIDFDLLVTDLAPVDLMLQRLGRLHRHAGRDRPRGLAQPRCLVVGADWDAQPPQPVSGSVRVYDQSALLRAAAALWPYLDTGRLLTLPDDIAPLVQEAYSGGQIGPGQWQPTMADAAEAAAQREHRRRERAKPFQLGQVQSGRSLIGWLNAHTGDVETTGDNEVRGRAHVRDGAESLEVLVLVRDGDRLLTPPWLNRGGGEQIPTDCEPPRHIVQTIASCTLPLPPVMSAPNNAERVITELEQRNMFSAWQRNPWLAGELVLDLDPTGQAQICEFAIEYDQHDGLKVTVITESHQSHAELSDQGLPISSDARSCLT